MRSSYDVIAVSSRLGTLFAAALLAKRGFRVLVIQHDTLPGLYGIEDLRLPRAPFNFTAADTPIARRIFAELALHQSFRQKAVVRDPAFQVVMPGHRFDLAAEPGDLSRELEREFPTVARAVEGFFAREAHLRRALDVALDQDLALPPSTFLERRAVMRALRAVPAEELSVTDPLREIPEEHPFRLVLHAPLRFADTMDPDYAHGLRARRAFASWCTGGATIDGGVDAVRELLLACVRGHKGQVLERDKIDRIHVDARGVVQGVRLAASGDDIGGTYVLLGGDVASYLGMLPDRRPFEELFERTGEPVVRYYRYTLNLVVRREAVPAGMARDAFVVRDPERPLAGANCLHLETHRADAAGRRTICVEALLPRRAVEEATGFLETLRESIVAAVAEVVPFLGENLLWVDSPHDGRPARDVVRGLDVEPSERWARGPRTMETVLGYPMTSTHGLTALPTRTPITNLLLSNEQVVPGLGLEGTMLAAWSAARIVGRSDGRADAFRRGLFRWLGG
jgi:phytoene dehydrogenase-like protein